MILQFIIIILPHELKKTIIMSTKQDWKTILSEKVKTFTFHEEGCCHNILFDRGFFGNTSKAKVLKFVRSIDSNHMYSFDICNSDPMKLVVQAYCIP